MLGEAEEEGGGDIGKKERQTIKSRPPNEPLNKIERKCRERKSKSKERLSPPPPQLLFFFFPYLSTIKTISSFAPAKNISHVHFRLYCFLLHMVNLTSFALVAVLHTCVFLMFPTALLVILHSTMSGWKICIMHML